MPRFHLLIAVLLLFGSAPAFAGPAESVLIRVDGRLTAPEVTRIKKEMESAADRGVAVIVLEVDADAAVAETGLELVAAIDDLAGRVRIVALVTGRAPGSASVVVLSCEKAVATSGASFGPVPVSGAVRDAFDRACRERDLPTELLHSAQLGGGILNAKAAASAGLVHSVADDRADGLARLEADPALAGRETGTRATVVGPFEKAFRIPIEGTIDDTLFASVKRRVELARAAGADLIVFEVDSPGGYVSSSIDLGDFIYALDIPTVMLIIKGAYSGAALVSLAGNEIVMGAGGIIGDCQPISYGTEGYEVLGEKIQSPLRALFRKYATRNGYPLRMAEAMVTQEMEVHRVEFPDDSEPAYLLAEEVEPATRQRGTPVTDEIVVRKDELLTLTADKARDYGFCGTLVKDREEALRRFGFAEVQVPILDESWAERTSRFLLAVKGLLFFIGILALYMELKAPGFGVPGAIAIICFALFFSASAVAGISSELEIILFLLGVGLLALEILVIPGFGVPGIAGVLLILVSLYMGSMKYGLPDFSRPWEVQGFVNWVFEFGSAVIASVVGMYFVARLLPKTRIGRRLILAPAGPPGSLGLTGSGGVAGQRAMNLAGSPGKALTDLRPAGRIEVRGEPYDAVTDGDFVGKGEEVHILRVKGNRIIVRKA